MVAYLSTGAPPLGSRFCGDDTAFDLATLSCVPEFVCGNGVFEGDEDCEIDWSAGEVSDLGGTCVSEGFDAGDIGCGSGCSYDTAGCRFQTCGDGFLDPPEACDDGNLVDGDGCSTACAIEGCAALSFNGVDNYAAIPNSASLNPTGALSLFARVRTTNAIQQNRGVAGKWDGLGTPGTEQYVLFVQSGKMRFALRTNGGSQSEVEDPQTHADGSWHAFAATWDGATLKLYRDGQLVDSTAVTGSIVAHDSPFEIGQYAGNLGGNRFEGEIDDVHLWSAFLSQAQVQAYDTCGPTGAEANLLAYWKLNEGTGTSLADASGNGNTGELFASPTWVDTSAQSHCSCQ